MDRKVGLKKSDYLTCDNSSDEEDVDEREKAAAEDLDIMVCLV